MEKHEGAEVPFRLFSSSGKRKKSSVDMNEVVGREDILFVCLDTLRYDGAAEEEREEYFIHLIMLALIFPYF